MKNYKWWVILFNLFLVLVLFNKSILDKERILSGGQLVLLKLAPVDARSFMQGDYMRLRYEISGNMGYDSTPKRGFCIVRLKGDGIAEKVRLQKDVAPLNPGEYPIEYTADRWNMNIGAESFFFEEGQGSKYDSARYGGIKIDKQGNSILIGLYDRNLEKIE
jgi:uncharacterized membrane-anchored protein